MKQKGKHTTTARRSLSLKTATRTANRRTAPSPSNLQETRSRSEKRYRISGHETFPCRYTWLPKAVRHLTSSPKLFSDEEQAMVDLGVGKNMVRAIRFWAQASGITETLKNGEYVLTDLARAVLGTRGHDRFLEDIRTLWLIHWNLSTDLKNPLLAWDFLLNRWQEPEIVPTAVLRILQKEAAKSTENFSVVTLTQHFETFLHTYVPTRGRKGEVQEDNLDCPLVELRLLSKIGEREVDHTAGKRESIYAFSRDEKPEITTRLFVYCLNDFWSKHHPTESTIPLREIAHGHGSPGQIFKLPEEDVRNRLQQLDHQTSGFLSYSESTNLQQLRKHKEKKASDLLNDVYSSETVYV